MNVRKSIACIVLALAAALPSAVCAQQAPEYDRDRYISEIRTYKHEFLAHELDIPRDRQQAFFEAYDAMEDEEMQLNQEIRDLERQVNADADATEAEIEAANSAIYSQKQKEAEIETRYYEIFKETLTPRQLLRLKSAERKFNQQLMRQHRRGSRGADQAAERRNRNSEVPRR